MLVLNRERRRLRIELLTCTLAVLFVSFKSLNAAPTLRALPEHLRPDAFGGIVAADRAPNSTSNSDLELVTPRGGYASCHLVVGLTSVGAYSLTLSPIAGASGIEISIYREWLHYLPAANEYIPDALIPLKLPYRSHLPSADNRVPGQTSQGFWVDIWVSKDTPPGNYTLQVQLASLGQIVPLALHLRVLSFEVPEEDAVVIDHNSYGASWLADQYPHLAKRLGERFFDSAEYFHLLHAYHRIFYEHHGILHQLGYGHAGKVSPEFAPTLEGKGKDRHIVDWALFDRHYAPLLDGSAFQNMHRPARPIPYVYLPINPEWPASFENWGEPGYEREFVNVVSAMERHFRAKGWVNTRFEMFFNHKKRYKGFSWDGDEARFPSDYAYFREYARLLHESVPSDSPVKFVFRADVSWTMERQWHELAGIVNFWVCGGGMFSWYADQLNGLKERGDTLWTYGGTPAVMEPSSHISLDVLRTWIQGSQGFVRWLTTAPGPDPWFQFDGGTETLVYPGDRFSLAEPIPSIRLKLERNTLQDLAVLNALASRESVAASLLRAGAVQSFNGTTLQDWSVPRPALANTDPLAWSNADIDDALQYSSKFAKELDAAAWSRVRTYIYGIAGREKASARQ